MPFIDPDLKTFRFSCLCILVAAVSVSGEETQGHGQTHARRVISPGAVAAAMVWAKKLGKRGRVQPAGNADFITAQKQPSLAFCDL